MDGLMPGDRLPADSTPHTCSFQQIEKAYVGTQVRRGFFHQSIRRSDRKFRVMAHHDQTLCVSWQ